jgi:hypothetical protein
MNDGIALLLERMKTNPEEFDAMGRDSKWENLVYKFNEWLDEEDKEVFKNAIKKMRQQKFTELVMEELVDPKKLTTQDIINQYQVKGIPSITQTITLEHNEHLKAHLNALGQTPIAGVTQTI